jgi:general secretion pathway protein K
VTAPRQRQRGVVLLLVLWVFMTLGVLALDFAQYMRDDATTAVNFSDETRGYYIAVAGLNSALYEAWQERSESPNGAAEPPDVNEPPEDKNGDGQPDQKKFVTDGEWHEGRFGDGVYAVRLMGEDGRIPLNVENVDDDLYQRLLKQIITNLLIGGNRTQGVNTKDEKGIETIVDSILDWRDCDKETRTNGAEDDYYLGLKHPYRAKNGFFESTQELLYVRGFTPDLLYGTEDHPGLIDVFSPFPKGHELEINADSITPAVVRALIPDMTESDAEDFLAGRKDDPESVRLFLQQQLEAAVPGLGQRVVRHVPEYVRIEARGDIRQKRNQSAVQALVQLPGANVDDVVVLEWIDRAPQRGEAPKLDADLAGATS